MSWCELEPGFFVAGQLEPADFGRAAEAGIRVVVNNRPDGESPGEMQHAEASAAAERAGLRYAYVPVMSGGLTPSVAASFAAAIRDADGGVLAYCRSGTRSCFLWALTAASRLEPARIVELAADRGYDVTPAYRELALIHAGRRRASA